MHSMLSFCTANDPTTPDDEKQLTPRTIKSLRNKLQEHFGGMHVISVEGKEGERELVWRWTPEGEQDPQKIDVMYVFGTTKEATLDEQAKWMKHAVKNSTMFARDICEMLGIAFVD